MPFCEKCGFKLNDDARFCPDCGAVNVVSTASSSGESDGGGRDFASTSPRTQLDDEGDYGKAKTDPKNLPKDYLLDDRFRIEKRIGMGGFAAVYKATDTDLNKVRALKSLF